MGRPVAPHFSRRRYQTRWQREYHPVGDNAAANVQRQWRRNIAVISGDMLRVGTFATYEFTAGGRLRATYSVGTSRSSATMSKVELAELTRPGAEISWTGYPTEFLDTTLNEAGRPVRLEVVLAKPAGSGPFPLAVFNHGSTGIGTNPALFKQTQWSPQLADFLVDRGWIVAFPQRRGRGKSDGRYDEGFAADRSQGYSCDPNRSLPGADRALTDIGAAIAALRRRTDVAMTPILIGGVSRGGILSIAYAGQHPQQVAGVVNFVGGWVGEGCSNASEINGALFRRGAPFQRPTLWLYGENDSTYSLGHSRSNFAAFQDAGGKGTFSEFEVPNKGNGHFISDYPQLWSDAVASYLVTLKAYQ